ncbi:MAG: response regulator transcription factor [Armatimonadetes bacterium]|nr:response regulator transcription factor [Armatimonadota bacterium]
MPEQVLIVEDERPIVDAVSYSLERDGFEVVSAFDGVQGLALARRERPDLIILDIMLPGMNGFEFCRALRRTSDVPIIILTARVEEVDRIVGLEMGADDYVTKPFSVRELVARVKAVLRRTHAESPVETSIMRSGDLEIDQGRHTVTRGGQPLELTLKEYDTLRRLMSQPGIVLSREVLLDTVWGDDECRDTRTVDVHIRWLREKIEENPSQPRRIVTVRGVGYKFVE